MKKNVNNDILIDCYSCAHSQVGKDRKTDRVVLVCSKTKIEAEGWCDRFVYEPGTDQTEREGIPMFLKKQAI